MSSREVQSALIAGDVFVDLITKVERIPAAGAGAWGTPLRASGGGTGGNIASALARLGVPTRLLTTVGDDDYGNQAMAELAAAGVDTSDVRVVSDTSSGVVIILVDAENERTIIPCALGSAYEKLDPDDAKRAIAVPAQHVLITGVALGADPVGVAYLELAERAHGHATLYFDPNLRQPADTLSPQVVARYRAIAGLADVILSGRAEIEALELTRREGQVWIEKAGSDGCRVIDSDGVVTDVPAPTVHAVDSTGAGDAFAAAYIAARARSLDVVESARHATAAGALTVASLGARIPLTWEQVELAMKGFE